MKKTSDDDSKEIGEMKVEYEFDYSKAKPNRFAASSDQHMIVLDADVAEYFKDSESVNKVLRALIATMPQPS